MNKSRVFKLVIALIMLVVASITVNKSLFGHKFSPAEEAARTPVEETALATDRAVIHTEGMEGTVEGYAGPVPVTIVIEEGKISEIEVMPNSETPSFLRRASVILDEWIGKTPDEGLAMDVDAVSGATYTSNALISNVNAGLSYFVGDKAEKQPEIPLKIWIALVVTLAACIVPLFVKSKVYYSVQLLANVIVLGFWTGQFLDYHVILGFFANGSDFTFGVVLAVMMIAAFIYPVFGKSQHYCSHICPLGSAQILMGQICGFKVKIPMKVIRVLEWVRRLLWGALMLTLWLDCWTAWLDWELFQAFQFESAAGWILGLAIFFVLLSAVVSRPYCRFVCPTGSLFKFVDNID